jgi:hypothetical protein
MKPIEYLFELINKSNISLLGYSFKQERIKDELISNISYIEIKEIDSSFSMLSLIRDLKIDSLFDDRRLPTHFLVDLSNIVRKDRGEISSTNLINNILKRIESQLVGTNFKLLIMSPINTFIDNKESFIGSQTPLYMADFAGLIREDNIKVIKDRNGPETIINYDSIK